VNASIVQKRKKNDFFKKKKKYGWTWHEMLIYPWNKFPVSSMILFEKANYIVKDIVVC